MAVFITLFILISSVLFTGYSKTSIHQTPIQIKEASEAKLSFNSDPNTAQSKKNSNSNASDAKVAGSSVSSESNTASTNTDVSNTSSNQASPTDASESEDSTALIKQTVVDPYRVPPRESIDPSPTKKFEVPTLTPGPAPIVLPIKPTCPPGVNRADMNCLDSN